MFATLFCLMLAAVETDALLPTFKLDSVTINERVDPKGGFFSETSEWTEADLPTSYIQHYILLDAPQTKVTLGKETRQIDETRPARGMDPKKLQVKWVRAPDVLAVSWKTHNLWGGRWEIEAVVILQRTTGEWKEVFRDYHESYYRAGLGYFSTGALSLEAEPQENLYTLTRRSLNVDTSYDPKPMYRKHEDPNQTLYIMEKTEIVKWPCRIDGDKLVCAEGTRWLELDKYGYPIAEIAAFLLREIEPGEVAKEVERLRALNPQLANSDTCTGSIKIVTAPPYVPQPEHRWSSS